MKIGTRMVAVSSDVYEVLKMRKQRTGVPVTKQIEHLVSGVKLD